MRVDSSASELQGASTTITPVDRLLANGFARALGREPMRIVLWDGTELIGESAGVRQRLHILSRSALLRLGAHPQLFFGECYGEGSVEIEGSLADAMTSLFRATGEPGGIHVAIDRAWARIHRNAPTRSLKVVHN